MQPLVQRKPGAQPGNQNARKHGFYSQMLSRDEKLRLKTASDREGLEEEIAVLRIKFGELFKNVWHCKRIVVDATGVGEPVAAFLQQALGRRVVPFKFTARSKSDLGFSLLAAVNSGRLKLFAPDGSPEYQAMLFELHHTRSNYRPDQTLNFYVDPSDGHDDFLMSLALLVESASSFELRTARGSIARDRTAQGPLVQYNVASGTFA